MSTYTLSLATFPSESRDHILSFRRLLADGILPRIADFLAASVPRIRSSDLWWPLRAFQMPRAFMAQAHLHYGDCGYTFIVSIVTSSSAIKMDARNPSPTCVPCPSEGTGVLIGFTIHLRHLRDLLIYRISGIVGADLPKKSLSIFVTRGLSQLRSLYRTPTTLVNITPGARKPFRYGLVVKLKESRVNTPP